MPRKHWIDKANSTTFQLVHRAQDDPKIHDAESSSMVFQELAPTQASKIKGRIDLRSELFDTTEANSHSIPTVRDNEGAAAEQGVYYDDTEYDYMQHLRDLNTGNANGESFFVEAEVMHKRKKGKEKLSLEEALRQSSLNEGTSQAVESTVSEMLDGDVFPSKTLRKSDYQDQQDTPDILAGFQPNMDPRLREVLEALEDEAYIDNEEDFFGEIAKDRQEVSLEDFEDNPLPEEDEGDAGWESDTTEKAGTDYTETFVPELHPCDVDISMTDTSDHGDGKWMAEFSKFKRADQLAKKAKPHQSNLDLQSSILTGTSMTGGRKKRRKGAMTSSTGYSMTSSSLFRTEGQSLLDARFDKIEEDYAAEGTDADESTASMSMTGSIISERSTTSSGAPSLVRADFDGMMDDFLNGYSMSGRKRVKKGQYQSGIESLDEIRKALGPARMQKAS